MTGRTFIAISHRLAGVGLELPARALQRVLVIAPSLHARLYHGAAGPVQVRDLDHVAHLDGGLADQAAVADRRERAIDPHRELRAAVLRIGLAPRGHDHVSGLDELDLARVLRA